MKKRILNVGSKRSDWTIVAEKPRKGPFRFWLCRCKCGFEKVFTTSYLNTQYPSCCERCRKEKREKSNSSLQKEMVGRKFGNFTIVKYAGKTGKNVKQWLCKCSCGNERVIRGSYLYGNAARRATLCNQCYLQQMELDNRVTNYIPRRFWGTLLCHAKRRKLKVSVTKKELLDLYLAQGRKCALSGVLLYFTKLRSNFYRYTNASLDRINPDAPYTVSNVQWLHKDVNMMKQRLTQEDFLLWCHRITERFSRLKGAHG